MTKTAESADDDICRASHLQGKPVRLFLSNFGMSNPCRICFTHNEMLRCVNREKVKIKI